MRKLELDNKGFSFIVPMTLAIIVGFAIMAIGVYTVGQINSSLEGSYPSNHPANYTGAGEAATWRTTRQNDSVGLLGNITNGFADVVDIEVVVIIITALSMAIFAVMAVGSRRSL
jgi:hypothetical protein